MNTTWLLLYRTLFRRCWLRSRLPSPGLALGALRKCSPSLAIIRHRCTLPHNPSPSSLPENVTLFLFFLTNFLSTCSSTSNLQCVLGRVTGCVLPASNCLALALCTHHYYLIFPLFGIFLLKNKNIQYRETPAAGANNDGWTKVGGGGSQRPKVRYSLETLRAMSKKPVRLHSPDHVFPDT